MRTLLATLAIAAAFGGGYAVGVVGTVNAYDNAVVVTETVDVGADLTECTVFEDGSGECVAPVPSSYRGPCVRVIIGGPYEGECAR